MIMTKRPNSFFNMQFITSSISTTLVLLLLGMVVFFVLSANNLSTYVRENIGISVLVSDDMKEPEATFSHEGFNKALKRFGDHTAHDCRHTFTTRIRKCGADLLTTQIILGHKPKTITERVYTHLSDEELLATVNLLQY